MSRLQQLNWKKHKRLHRPRFFGTVMFQEAVERIWNFATKLQHVGPGFCYSLRQVAADKVLFRWGKRNIQFSQVIFEIDPHSKVWCHILILDFEKKYSIREFIRLYICLSVAVTKRRQHAVYRIVFNQMGKKLWTIFWSSLFCKWTFGASPEGKQNCLKVAAYSEETKIW